jgi:hypothetical protein
MSKDIVVEAQRDEVLDFGPITRISDATGLPVGIDLSVAGTKLWFTVKANLDDTYAEALIAKTYVQGGSPDGFAITTPISTDDPNGTITIERTLLAYDDVLVAWWDLTIEEPGGRRSTVDGGAFKIRLPVSDPA